MDETKAQTAGLYTNIEGWLKHPFNASGSALNWVLFLGLVILAAFFWQLVLLKITEA